MKNSISSILKVIFLCWNLYLPSISVAADKGLAETGAYSSNGFAGGVFTEAICDIYELMSGNLGAFLTSAALLTCIVISTVGGMGMVKSAIIVAVGSFTISSGVSLYFGTFSCGIDPGGGGLGGNTPIRSAVVQTIQNDSDDVLDFNR